MSAQKKARKTAPAAEEKPADHTGDSNAFAVSASVSLAELKPLVLKHGNAFGVFDSKGRCHFAAGRNRGRLLLRHAASVAFRDHAKRSASNCLEFDAA